MKSLLIYITAFSLFVSCKQDPKTNDSSKPSSVSISVLFDITDPKLFVVAPDQILQLFNCEENPTAEFAFHLKAISDKRLNPRTIYHLANASTTDKKNYQRDPQNRNRNISAFYNTVRKSLNDFYSQTDTSNHMQNSECFKGISDELILLAKDTSKQKTLIAFTDLRERGNLLDSYSEDISQPMKIAEKLDSVYPRLPSLKGIKVFFIFNPHTRKEDNAFSFMAEAYKILLQKKGAVVSIQANL